jgi:hypothetical protein
MGPLWCRSGECLESRAGIHQVRSVETLGEPGVEGLEQLPGIVKAARALPLPSHADRAQLDRPGLLPAPKL